MDRPLIRALRDLAHTRSAHNGPAHDFLHVMRVAANVSQIGLAEGANLAVVLPAALLHELFNYPKGHPQSHLSGEVCATQAAEALHEQDCPADLIEPICECIRTHAFSRGLAPATLEGKVLQDADRLDAIGAIGIARCFATCTEMGIPFYHPDDPFCEAREPDDRQWGLDHFYRKLLRIADGFHTKTARSLAADRVRLMKAFLEQLGHEIRIEQPAI
jgi:uncharacterized protein